MALCDKGNMGTPGVRVIAENSRTALSDGLPVGIYRSQGFLGSYCVHYDHDIRKLYPLLYSASIISHGSFGSWIRVNLNPLSPNRFTSLGHGRRRKIEILSKGTICPGYKSLKYKHRDAFLDPVVRVFLLSMELEQSLNTNGDSGFTLPMSPR